MHDSYIHNRKSLRLKHFDYSQNRAYFITICTQNRELLFGDVVGDKVIINEQGIEIKNQWESLAERFNCITLDEFVVMPNHVHGIIFMKCDDSIRANTRFAPTSNSGYTHPRGTVDFSVGRIMQAFKSITTHEYILGVKNKGWKPFSGKLWQRNYYEHIIRDEEDFLKVKEYIQYNPLRWMEDSEKPNM